MESRLSSTPRRSRSFALDHSRGCSDLYDTLAEVSADDEAEADADDRSDAEADGLLSSTTCCRGGCFDTAGAVAGRRDCKGRRGTGGLIRFRADGAADGAAVEETDESADDGIDSEPTVKNDRADGCSDELAVDDCELSTDCS